MTAHSYSIEASLSLLTCGHCNMMCMLMLVCVQESDIDDETLCSTGSRKMEVLTS